MIFKQTREVLTAGATLTFLLTVITSGVIGSGALYLRYFKNNLLFALKTLVLTHPKKGGRITYGKYFSQSTTMNFVTVCRAVAIGASVCCKL